MSSMRASCSASVVLIGTASLLVGCSRTTSPTSPTSVPLPIGASSASSIGASTTESPLAVSSAAQHQVPFNGRFQGSDAVVPPTIATTATGTGTHLGQFSFTHVLTFPTLTGSAHWVAANGDTIDSTSVIVSSVLGPVVRTNTEDHTITGGTGRFSGAHGNFRVVRTHVLAPSDDGTHVTSGSFEGTITSPGAAH
jgi:hypothetical protein